MQIVGSNADGPCDRPPLKINAKPKNHVAILEEHAKFGWQTEFGILTRSYSTFSGVFLGQTGQKFKRS